ncbi:citrate lyase beta subunit [Rhodofomes roseus]|uniref:Citrate lyase beta subunit n=1 Tax=Rhodofomes roseus TaxID=34475 RepID=A0ABQ8KSU8_9APHY|nr:citrate lyase beta subunit [Rhodofomes roseus]KAH9841516.1 citrate lyase beta subunit [Rhodofomes roseus]
MHGRFLSTRLGASASWSLASFIPATSTARTIHLRRTLAGANSSRTDPRTLTTASHINERTQLNRSYLYVPAASERMLQKSLVNSSDILIYDLEDSVPPTKTDKEGARERLVQFLRSKPQTELPRTERIAIRLNSTNTPFFEDDLAAALQVPSIRTLVLPKVHSVQDLDHVSRMIYSHSQLKTARNPAEQPLRLVASIESARALVNLGTIASWRSEFGPSLQVSLSALLFAAEDYCADTSIIRTKSRQELLYTRSQIAITSKAFGLDAIDMVCVNYKDLDYLKEECEDGRRLGFNGKQAIHPTQVDIIQSTFVPTEQEILRAARIVKKMEQAHGAQRGAIGLELEGGGKEMIDAPMLKQAENTVRIARAAGLPIPDVQ